MKSETGLRVPEHIAIIMDGNGRWAEKRGRPRVFGHVKGTRTAKKIINSCSRRGVKHLTLYAFSTENWFRPENEVNFLMRLLRRYMKRERETLVKENVRFTTIGELNRLPPDIIREINITVDATKNNTGLHLVFAISYGSRQEITDTVKSICRQIAVGELSISDLDENTIEQHQNTYGTPDPDLIIRTSGENRLSNFLMWQAAYSELYFSSTLWPDFSETDLEEAIFAYARRERRFGRIFSIKEFFGVARQL